MQAASSGTIAAFRDVPPGTLFIYRDEDASRLGLKALFSTVPAIVTIAPGKVAIQDTSLIRESHVLQLEKASIHPLPRVDRIEIIEGDYSGNPGPLILTAGQLRFACLNAEDGISLIDAASGEVARNKPADRSVVYYAWIVTLPSETSPADRDVVFSFDAMKSMKLGF